MSELPSHNEGLVLVTFQNVENRAHFIWKKYGEKINYFSWKGYGKFHEIMFFNPFLSGLGVIARCSKRGLLDPTVGDLKGCHPLGDLVMSGSRIAASTRDLFCTWERGPCRFSLEIYHGHRRWIFCSGWSGNLEAWFSSPIRTWESLASIGYA